MKKLFYKEEGEKELGALYTDGEFSRFFRLPRQPYTGSIIVGKVKFVKAGVGVFVDIGLPRDGLLPYHDGLKSGDGVLVCVEDEPTQERGCPLSLNIKLAGKNVVLVENGKDGFSRELSDERKKLLMSLPRYSGVGFIFRSRSETEEIEKIKEEMKDLFEKYTQLKKDAALTKPPKTLYSESAKEIMEKMADEMVNGFLPETERQIAELSARKIIREGIELVFDKTEALTVVDVNFHASEKRGEDAIFAADEIAVKEFARQIKLRNIGGMIILDYIGLASEAERDGLFDLLEKELKKDYVRCTVEHALKSQLFIVTRPKRYSF